MIRTKLTSFICIIFAFSITCASTANRYDSIIYNFKLGKNKTIFINAKYEGEFTTKTVIELPYKWAGTIYSPQIKNVCVQNKDTKFSINQNNAHQIILELNQPTTTLEINYEIHPTKNEEFEVQKIITRDDLFHSTGYALWAVPEDIDESQKLNIEINWQNIPKDWKILSSHDKGKSMKFSATTFQLLHANYIAGTLREYKKSINGKTINFAINGNFDFTDKQLINQAPKIIKSQRDFFDDYDYDSYLIIIIENPNGTEKLALMGGSSFHNSFFTNLSSKITFLQYKTLLAHEHLHNWIGIKIKNSEEALNYWWSEGFTDYYSRVLAARNKALSFDEFILEINNMLEDYYKSPQINAPNSQIAEKFYHDYDTEKLPYYRGFAFALYLNCQMQSVTPTASTDLILKELFKNHKTTKFSNKYFVNLLKKYINPKDTEKWFKNYIENGDTILFNNFKNALPLEKKYFKKPNKTKNNFYYQLPIKPTKKERQQIKKFFGMK